MYNAIKIIVISPCIITGGDGMEKRTLEIVWNHPGEILLVPVDGKHPLLVHSSLKQRNENLALLKSFLSASAF